MTWRRGDPYSSFPSCTLVSVPEIRQGYLVSVPCIGIVSACASRLSDAGRRDGSSARTVRMIAGNGGQPGSHRSAHRLSAFLPFALSAILRINHQAPCVDRCRTRVCNRPSICRAVSAPRWDRIPVRGADFGCARFAGLQTQSPRQAS
jgi:hypothetical protein